MAQQEYTGGLRCGSYSAWHRTASIGRFISDDDAYALSMIDLDHALYVEFDSDTKSPLILIETAIDTGKHKTGAVLRSLANRAGLLGYVVLYTISDTDNPSTPGTRDILSFRVKRVAPGQESQWQTMTPAEWAECLVALRSSAIRKQAKE